MKIRNRKTAVTGIGVCAAIALVAIQPLSSNAATPLLEVTTTQSKDSALYSGDTINFTVQVKNVGN